MDAPASARIFTTMSQTNKNIIYAGIDVAKRTLALDGPGGRCQLANEPNGHGGVVKLLANSDLSSKTWTGLLMFYWVVRFK